MAVSRTGVRFDITVFRKGSLLNVVINATERDISRGYAELAGAVRTLVDEYKLQVIVDGSPNSISDSLLRTERQRVFDIKPLTHEMIFKLEQLQELFKYVKDAGLEDTVFAVLGGIPAKYEKLWYDSSIDLRARRDAREVIGTHLCAVIAAAVTLVRKSKSESNHMNEIIELFDAKKVSILCDTLVEKKLMRPSPDKVFREVEQGSFFVLIPASNAIGIVLRHGITKKPSLTELEELLKNKA